MTNESTRQLAPNVNSRRYYWLDWLRFVAALMVVACHARGGNWVEWGRLDGSCQTEINYLFFVATRAGFEWVVVFFVLSGFLVGGKVLERVGNQTFNATTYGLDRLSRIWTPLIPALVLTVGVSWYLGHDISVGGFIGNLLGLQGIVCWNFGENHPLWSLAYEIWFYLLAGCAAVSFSQIASHRIIACMGFALCVMVFTKLNATFLFCWVLGSLSYHQIGLSRKSATAGCVLAVVGYMLCQITSETSSFEKYAILNYAPSREVATLTLSAGLALIIPFLSQFRPASRRIEALERLGSPLAAFSYTLYLTHYPLLQLWSSWFPKRHGIMSLTSMLWYSCEICLCTLVAWLLYLPFERNTGVVRSWLRRSIAKMDPIKKSVEARDE